MRPNQLQNCSAGPEDPKSVLAEDPLYTQVGYFVKSNYSKKLYPKRITVLSVYLLRTSLQTHIAFIQNKKFVLTKAYIHMICTKQNMNMYEH